MNTLERITSALAHTINERKEIETKEKALKMELQALMHKAGKETLKTPYGKFSIAQRQYWAYPEEILDEISDYKARISAVEQKAQFEGLAEEKVTEYIMFKEI